MLQELGNGQEKMSPRQEALEILRDQKKLPSRAEVQQAFRSYEAYDYGRGADGEEVIRTSVHNDEFQAQLAETGSEQEIINQEFISSLADHLIRELKSKDEPTIILEVGAGNGRLSHFLSEALNEKSPGTFNIIATNKADERWDIKPVFKVENIDYKDALEKYRPDVVLSSWMPRKKDWTADIRNTPSVREYLLVGEQDSTGDSELTWGIDVAEKESPYAKDGFDCKRLADVSNNQIGRSGMGGIGPETYAFRRHRDV